MHPTNTPCKGKSISKTNAFDLSPCAERMLLPFQGGYSFVVHTQGAALGYVLTVLSGLFQVVKFRMYDQAATKRPKGAASSQPRAAPWVIVSKLQFRPARAKAYRKQMLLPFLHVWNECFCPFRAGIPSSFIPRALPWADCLLPLWGASLLLAIHLKLNHLKKNFTLSHSCYSRSDRKGG